MVRSLRLLFVSLVIAAVLVCVVAVAAAVVTGALHSWVTALAFVVALLCAPLLPWIASVAGPRAGTAPTRTRAVR